MNLMPATRGCFVIGTDTEIGKTTISAALLHLLAQDGSRAMGCKPVSAGLTVQDGESFNEDVRALREAGSVALSDDEIGPCQLAAACAPHIAAELEGIAIDRHALLAAVRRLASRADWLVVEGVGGFRVPLAQGWDAADLACDVGLPAVLVVGLRLGCLNHALLTAEAIAHRGLRLAGWVGNTVDPAMAHLDANIASLRQYLPAPCLGIVPRLDRPTPHAVAAFLDANALRTALGTIE
jgi:dethiobiotin synthetase